jgi:lipoate-protein ligase A
VPTTWRVLVDAPATGAWNMAVDEALAREIEPGSAVLRLYEWLRPTVSFGRNQPAQGRYDLTRAAELGLDFVRRPTGGRAVLHDRELTYAVVLPDSSYGGPRAIYSRVQAALALALREAGAGGIEQEPASNETAPRPSIQPCFGTALPGEVTLGGRKIVGSAQARISGSVLQHGAILLLNDQSALQELAPSEPASLSPAVRPATLAEADVDLSPAALAAHVERAFETALGAQLERSGLTPRERVAAESLRDKFESHEWTWRR